MSDLGFLERLLDGADVEWKPLGYVAEYSKTRIGSDQLTDKNHVGVDNLLQKRGGRADSTHVPTSGNLTAYHAGDVLIGNIRPYLRKIWLADRTGGTNGDVLVVHPTDSIVDPRYLYQVLTDESFFEYNIQHSKGAKMPRGSKPQILLYQIPIPCPEDPEKSLAIQAEIVRILDAFTELTAELKARKEQYNHYRDRLLSFEDVDVEWRELETVANFTNGKGHEKGISADGKYIVINSKFISTSGRVAKHTDNQICPLYTDDILLVMSDPPNGKALAKTFIVDADDKYTLNQRIGGISVKNPKHLLPKFLYYFLNRNKQLTRFDNGADQTNLRKGQILSVQIPIPFPNDPEKSLKEQARIVAILDKFDALTTSFSEGLPREIKLRQQQYEYYRDLLLSFPKPDEAA